MKNNSQKRCTEDIIDLHLQPLSKAEHYLFNNIIPNKVDTLSYKTVSANKATANQKWHVVDAEGQTVGRLASNIATVLRGKHKPNYTPHVDCGDYVIVLNADKIRFTGAKLDNKTYLTYSGYPGGQKSATAKEIMDKKPLRIMEMAVRGMLPKTKLGRAMIKKLFLYEGTEHKHAAQQPTELKF